MTRLLPTGYYPYGTRVELKEAEGWKNLSADSEEPLAAKFEVQYSGNLIQMAPTVLAGAGYADQQAKVMTGSQSHRHRT